MGAVSGTGGAGGGDQGSVFSFISSEGAWQGERGIAS